MAVLIQEGINADSAGVMITADPYNPESKERSISVRSAVWDQSRGWQADRRANTLSTRVERDSRADEIGGGQSAHF